MIKILIPWLALAGLYFLGVYVLGPYDYSFVNLAVINVKYAALALLIYQAASYLYTRRKKKIHNAAV